MHVAGKEQSLTWRIPLLSEGGCLVLLLLVQLPRDKYAPNITRLYSHHYHHYALLLVLPTFPSSLSSPACSCIFMEGGLAL
jgi:hypothetical protein